MVTLGIYGSDENVNYAINIHHEVTCNYYTGLGKVRNHEVFVLINHGFPSHTSVTDVCKIQNYHIPSRTLCAASVDWLCGQ